MDNYFTYFQLGGCVTFTILAMMLIFSRTFESKHAIIYKRSRLMLIFGTALLALHFAIQLYTGWRTTNEPMAIMLNMIFFPISGLLMIYSLQYMFRKEELSMKEIFWNLWIYFVINAILVYAYMHPRYLYTMECIAAIVITIQCVVLIIILRNHFLLTRARMENYFGRDTNTATSWIGRVILIFSICIICVPFAILSSSTILKCISLLNFAAIFFVVNRFIYYGYDIQKMIDLYYEAIEADCFKEETEEVIPEATKITSKETSSYYKDIEENIGNWIEKKAFIDPELTIEDLVHQTGLRRSPLTNYLNNILGHSFRGWLNTLRIAEAKEIMAAHPDYSHETIADLSGFSSRTYFLKVFKDKEGITPGEWSEAHKKGI